MKMKELRRALFFVPDEFDEHEVVVRYAPQSESPGHSWEVCNPTEKDPTVRITIYEQRSMAQRYEYSIERLDLDRECYCEHFGQWMNEKVAQGWHLKAAGTKIQIWERPLDERVEIPVSGQGVPQEVIERMRNDHSSHKAEKDCLGWIPVSEDTMPECLRIDDEKRSKQLLFLTRDRQIHYGFYSYYPIGEWCSEDGSLVEDIPCSSGEVTHWMPFPEVPIDL